MNDSDRIDFFYDLSEVLTGYKRIRLYATGQGDFYFATLNEILGTDLITELLVEFESLVEQSNKPPYEQLKSLIRQKMFENHKWGPICKNMIKMWFMGNWYKMPDYWREDYVNSTADIDKVLSANTYIEGLVWAAMERHPKSAKQPGFGTWAFPPQSTITN